MKFRWALGLVLTAATAPAMAATLPPKHACLEELLADPTLEALATKGLYPLLYDTPRAYWEVVVPQWMIGFMAEHRFDHVTFAFFERWFRRREIPIWLIARVDAPPPGWLSVHVPPHHERLGARAPYWLWTEIRSEAIARAVKEDWGTDEAENLRRLEETGVPAVVTVFTK